MPSNVKTDLISSWDYW